MKMRTWLLAAVGLVSAWNGPAPGAQTFRSTTELVNVSATVTDKSGRIVTGLGESDFILEEDGKPQEVAFFRFDNQTPVSVALVVDTSGSMVDKLDDVRDALRHFVSLLTPDDDVFLLQFSDRVELMAEPDQRDTLDRRIARLEASGGTALFDAVEEGTEVVSRGRHPKRVVILITDGNDTNSRSSRRDAMNAVGRSEALLYGVGIGHGEAGSFGHGTFGGGPFGRNPLGHGSTAQPDRVDAGALKDLAEPTGGTTFVLEQAHRTGRDLVDEALQQIVRELREQYTLGYYPTNTARDGKFHRISLETRDRSLKVRARRGYWAARGTGGPDGSPSRP
jgi:Ca-activated chloride channel family protein